MTVTTKTATQQSLGLLVWLLLCFGTSALGAAASLQAGAFYGGLIQPDWAPPAGLFGPVWTLLFVMMALAVWRIWCLAPRPGARLALALFVSQLIANALWSWLFFAWQSGGGALANILVLWGLILACLVTFWRVSQPAALLLLPYLGWVSFAALLNYRLWQLNPQLLG